MPSREQIISVLRAAFEPLDACRAVWLGGSDATGRSDELSDVDIQALVRDDAVESIFAAAEAALSGLAPIAHRYRVPEPSWHGHSQCFYALRGLPPEWMVDLTVMKASAPPAMRFMEPERHGRPVVLFDKDAALVPVPLDRAAHETKIQAKLTELRARVPVLAPLVLKAVRRGNAPEAAAMYHGIVLRGLVDLLRILHCPDRYDFGLRYIRADLPIGVAAAVERLALPGTLEQVAASTREALEIFERTMPEAEKRWLPTGR